MRRTLTTLVLATAMSLGTPFAFADEGDVIDKCWLAADDVLRCSTPNRRAALIDKALLERVRGFDLSERLSYIRAVAVAWLDRQPASCRDAAIDVDRVFNAYNAPGTDNGLDIAKLENSCERAFATWLFKKENHGMPPGEVARVNTMVTEDVVWAKEYAKECRAESKAVVKVARAWLAATKLLDKASRKETLPDATASLEQKAQDAFDERQVAVRALNACINRLP